MQPSAPPRKLAATSRLLSSIASRLDWAVQGLDGLAPLLGAECKLGMYFERQ
jgi:hypothetical protein